jgi:hypothetical protein
VGWLIGERFGLAVVAAMVVGVGSFCLRFPAQAEVNEIE